MKRGPVTIIFVLFLVITVALMSVYLRQRADKNVTISSNCSYARTLREDLFSLMMAYPEHIVDIEVVNNSKVYIVMKSGKKILYDDGLEKTPLEKLQNPDLQDMMEELYILASTNELMPENYNPGRIRVYPLLKEVYGYNKLEIEKNLTGVRIGNIYYRFNKNNRGAYHLNKAFEQLNQLVKKSPEAWSYIYPIGGTYNFRYISKTNRLSPHAFGISIDLASNKNDYWQWTTRSKGQQRIKGYPYAIVSIMENHYFIWGGKWGKFDIFHFEYRPELIIKAKYFTNNKSRLWYENLPVEDMKVSQIIWLIEERLQEFIKDNP